MKTIRCGVDQKRIVSSTLARIWSGVIDVYYEQDFCD